MNTTFATITQFKKMLNSLSDCMKKASAYADHKKFDVDVLAKSRLAPDMFPFIGQIQSACDAAKFAAAYLAQQKPPKHDDNETTWVQLNERLQKVITYLEAFKAEDFKDSASVKVTPGWAKGKWLPAEEYLQQVAVPNFYFHIGMAYALLRHAGVDVGKLDYLGPIQMRE